MNNSTFVEDRIQNNNKKEMNITEPRKNFVEYSYDVDDYKRRSSEIKENINKELEEDKLFDKIIKEERKCCCFIKNQNYTKNQKCLIIYLILIIILISSSIISYPNWKNNDYVDNLYTDHFVNELKKFGNITSKTSCSDARRCGYIVDEVIYTCGIENIIVRNHNVSIPKNLCSDGIVKIRVILTKEHPVIASFPPVVLNDNYESFWKKELLYNNSYEAEGPIKIYKIENNGRIYTLYQFPMYDIDWYFIFVFSVFFLILSIVIIPFSFINLDLDKENWGDGGYADFGGDAGGDCDRGGGI